MSNHPRRRHRGKRHHLMDQRRLYGVGQRRRVAGRVSGSARRRAKAIQRRERVYLIWPELVPEVE